VSYDVIMGAHNEQEYIRYPLLSLSNQTIKPSKLVVVLDRCTDRTPEIVSKLAKELPFKVDVIFKDRAGWVYSQAENLELGRKRTSSEFVAIVDADVILDKTYFEFLLKNFRRDVGVLSGDVITVWNGLFGSLYYAWDRISRRVKLPAQENVRGCAMLIRSDALDEIGGFADVFSPDTYVQMKIRGLGYKVMLLREVKAYHIRRMGFSKIFANQYAMGISRAHLGFSLVKTLAHSAFRCRPLVLAGYLKYLLS